MTTLKRAVVAGGAALLLGGSVFVRAQPQSTAAPAQPIDFDRDIQPIFKTYCYECHGPRKARARLRLHAPEFIRKGGESGPVISPGRSSDSLLMHRVLGLHGDDRMPLDADALPDNAIATLRAWIDQGAPGAGFDGVAVAAPSAAADVVEEHWAYVKPSRPELPAVKTDGWVRNPIDRFVLARLESEGLAPSTEAARATLLRRVTLDLI